MTEPSPDRRDDLCTGLDTDPPSVLPLEQRARLQSVTPQLEYAALIVGWRGGEEGELLAQLGPAGVDEGSESIEVLDMWAARRFDEFHRPVVSRVVLEFEDVD